LARKGIAPVFTPLASELVEPLEELKAKYTPKVVGAVDTEPKLTQPTIDPIEICL
jgi:hypothetical protein